MRKPFCPQNGCGMFNGASMPRDIACKQCGVSSKNDIRLCPSCKKCKSCDRIGKKFFKED